MKTSRERIVEQLILIGSHQDCYHAQDDSLEDVGISERSIGIVGIYLEAEPSMEFPIISLIETFYEFDMLSEWKEEDSQ